MSAIDRQRKQSVYGSTMGLPNNVTMDYDYNIGARVLVHGENSGTVRYVGATGFQTGRWIGVELDEPKGKNAGVVQGKRYFDCRAQHGVFVRPTQVKLLPPSPLNSSNSSRRRSIYNNDCSDDSSNSDDFIGDRSSTAPLNQQKQLYSPSQQQMRTNPTATPSKRLSSQPSSTKSSAPSSTAKKRPTSLTDNPTPRASITLSAAQNRRQSISSKQQQPAVTSRTSTVRPLPQQNNNSSFPMEPSSVKATPSSRLQALKMKQLQQLQYGQQQQQQQLVSSSSSQQSSDMDYTDEEDIDDDYGYHDEDEEVSEQDVINDDDEAEDDDDDIMTNYTDDDQIESVSYIESDHSAELDIDSGIDEQLQDYQQTTPSMINPQQVYGALSSTKPISKSDQVVPLKDYEELRFKLKILEAKRQEDRERLREHEKIKEEAEQFLTLRNKLQDKIADLQKDVRETKRDLKDALEDKESFENKYMDALESLEMMALDKEMAEERVETLNLEVILLTDKIEEISIDLDVVKKETDRLDYSTESTGYEDGKSSLEVAQLERHNERLKEVLIRLRDATAEKEADLTERIKALERESFGFNDIKEQCAQYKEKLDIAEYQMDDLKQQLDDALGAEDLVDQLTEKNLDLNEKLEEMRATVDDLEALKELADELEEDHVETEKQLEAEIGKHQKKKKKMLHKKAVAHTVFYFLSFQDHRDMLLREQWERLKSFEETSADYESTIQQFRELVALLQSDLEHLRQKEESKASEKHNLSSQSQAMMSLNLQLQSTVMKAQAKSIDLELRKLEGAQAADRLSYIQPYLPDAFFKTENEPISCLLLFKRLVFKSDLIIKHLDQNHPISEKIIEDVAESLVTVCEMRQKAGWLGDIAKRFISFIKHCEPNVFVQMNQVYHELLGTERRLNTIVELFRTDDITDTTCLYELQRIIAQLEHLTEAYLGQYGESNNADQFFALTRALDFNADRMTVDFTYIQQLVHKAVHLEDIYIEEGTVALDMDYLEPLTRLVVLAKNSKISARKLLRRLEELSEEALTLKADHLHRIKTLYTISSKLCAFCYDLCHQITAYVDTKRGSKEAISVKVIQQLVREKADEVFDIPESTLWEAGLKILKSLTSELATTLTRVENDHKKEKIASSISPWIQRASDMKAEVMVNQDLEQKLQQHNDEIIRLIKDVKLKDQSLQEASVKVDLLERRMVFAKKEAEQLSQLEDALEKVHGQEQMYMEAIDNLQAEYDLLEQENVQLKKDATEKEETRQSLLKKINYDDIHVSAAELSKEPLGGYRTADSRVQTLLAAIRFLRSENAQLKSQDLVKSLNIQQLPEMTITKSSNSNLNAERARRIQSMASEARTIVKDMRVANACTRLVELYEPPASDSTTKRWQSVKKTPSYQYQAQQSILYTLKQRTHQLQQTIRAMSHEKDGSHSIAAPAKNLSSSPIRTLAKIKIPLPQIIPAIGSTSNHHHCIQLNGTKEFDRIHSLFIH